LLIREEERREGRIPRHAIKKKPRRVLLISRDSFT
jgi:hypothetical protein